MRACERHELDVSICAPGNLQYTDIMISASQAEHMAHYLAVHLLLKAGEISHSIHVNLRTAKQSFIEIAFRPFQDLRGFQHARFTISPEVRRAIPPPLRRAFVAVAGPMTKKTDSFLTAMFPVWLDTSNRFLDHIERLAETDPPPMKQICILLRSAKTLGLIPRGMERAMQLSLPYLYARYILFLSCIFYLAQIPCAVDSSDVESYYWLPAFVRPVLRTKPHLGPEIPQAMVMKAYRMLDGVEVRTGQDRTLLHTMLTDILELSTEHNFDVLTKEVRQRLDDLDQTMIPATE